MESIKIFHIIRSNSWGGLEIYVCQLIHQLQLAGYEQAVWCLEGSLIHKELETKGLPLFLTSKPSKFSWKEIQSLKKWSQTFDIVHTHTNKDIWPASLALLAGAKFKQVFSLYMGVANKRDFWHSIIYSKVSALVSSSQTINDEVAEKYPLPKHHIHLIRYGRAIELYQKDENIRQSIRSQYNVAADALVVGTLARIDEGKGVIELVESALYLPEEVKKKVQIWLIGDRSIVGRKEDGQPQYEKKSADLYIHLQYFIKKNKLEETVRLIPFQKEYISYLVSMDIFTLLSWDEMYSLSVIDAMYMGLPSIGTQAGGTPEQLGEGRGLLIPIKSPKDMAGAIEKLVLDPQMRQTMGEKSKTWVHGQHNWAPVLEKWKNLYRSLLA